MKLLPLLCVPIFLITGCQLDDSPSEITDPIGGNTTPVSSPDPTPTPDPMPIPPSSFEQEMLSAVNTARAKQRSCGGTVMPAVASVSWSPQLERASAVHSSNMANYNFFSHTGLDGKSVSDRIEDEGYSWMAVGENIAAGQQNISAVMDGWLKSPGHCKNIMNATYTQMGASSVTNASSQYGIYWTQVFAKPRG